MTSYQENLIAKLKAPRQWNLDQVSFNGNFLNCVANVKSGNKIKKQKFSFLFDSADDCQGARLVGKLVGAYSEWYAKDAFELIVAYSNEIGKDVIK